MSGPWRPWNESEEDLENEEEAKLLIQEAWACRVEKLSAGLYNIDWAFTRGSNDVVGFGEFKDRRKNWEERFESVMLGLAKVHKLCELDNFTGKPAWFFVRLPHGIFYCRPTRVALRLEELRLDGNRRGQNGDLEPCYFIKLEDFTPVALIETFA